MAETITHHDLPLPRLDAPVRLLAVVAPSYKQIADDLLAGAQAMAADAGVSLDVVHVPGAREIPTAVALASARAGYDGFVALGCVIRGHDDTVRDDSARGLTLLGLRGICIGNGIITAENLAQAQVAADPAGRNAGGAATAAALHLIALSRRWTAAATTTETLPQRDLIRLAGELDGEGRA